MVDVVQIGDQELKHRTRLVATEETAAFYRQHGCINAKAVGMPFSYIDPDPNTERIPGSLLVMPPHTLVREKVQFDEIAYLDYIQSISKHFSRVVFCLSVPCVINNLWKDNIDKYGYDYVIGAGLNDQNALYRMRKLFDSFEYMTSNVIGSHVLYAAFCGVKVSLAGPYYDYTDPDESIDKPAWVIRLMQIENEMSRYSFVSKKFPWFFKEPQDAVTCVEWAKKEIGFYNKVPFEELARLLFTKNPIDSEYYIEKVMQLDAENNATGFIEFIQDKRFCDPEEMTLATKLLLAKGRIRSAIVLARLLMDRKHLDPVISIANNITHLVTERPLPIAQGYTLEDLQVQVDALSNKQQTELYNEMIIPLISTLLVFSLQQSNNDHVLHILNILKAAAPQFRTVNNWDLKLIDGVIYNRLF